MADVKHSHICPDGTLYHFIWDPLKDELNQEDHHIALKDAVEAFCDPRKITRYDKGHSSRREKRFFLFGKLGKGRVLTVRFTRRDEYIRIIGAGFWRDGQALYDNTDRR